MKTSLLKKLAKNLIGGIILLSATLLKNTHIESCAIIKLSDTKRTQGKQYELYPFYNRIALLPKGISQKSLQLQKTAKLSGRNVIFVSES